jgi:hypothetical protein
MCQRISVHVAKNAIITNSLPVRVTLLHSDRRTDGHLKGLHVHFGKSFGNHMILTIFKSEFELKIRHFKITHLKFIASKIYALFRALSL